MSNKVHILLVLILMNVLFVVSNIPIIHQVFYAPKKTICTLVHGPPVDYYLYLSAIRESRDGEWSFPALYTTEETNRSFLYIFFIVLGKTAKIFNLSPITAYHVSRLFSFELFILGIYFIGTHFFSGKTVIWPILIGFLSTAPSGWIVGRLGWKQQLWWSEAFDPIARVNGLPHHLFGLGILLLTIVAWFHYVNNRQRKSLFLCAIGSFLTGLIFPPAGLVLLTGVPLTIIVQQFTVFLKRKAPDMQLIAASVVITTFSLLSLLFLKFQTQLGFPWSQWSKWDVAMWNNNAPHFITNYYIGTFLLLILAVPALIKLMLSGKHNFVFICIWAILPYIILPFTDILQIGKIRVVYMANYIPLGILGYMTLKKLSKKIITSKFRKLFLPISLCIIFLYFGSVSYANNQQYIVYPREISNHFCIPAATMRSIKFISQNSAPYKTVLAEFLVGNVLPAYAKVKTYLGSWTQTKDFEEKTVKIWRFYSGNMNEEEATGFIKEGKINYIYIGLAEASYKGNIEKYNLPIELVYNEEDIKIYEVKDDKLK